jgi:hypothetical protein
VVGEIGYGGVRVGYGGGSWRRERKLSVMMWQKVNGEMRENEKVVMTGSVTGFIADKCMDWTNGSMTCGITNSWTNWDLTRGTGP